MRPAFSLGTFARAKLRRYRALVGRFPEPVVRELAWPFVRAALPPRTWRMASACSLSVVRNSW